MSLTETLFGGAKQSTDAVPAKGKKGLKRPKASAASEESTPAEGSTGLTGLTFTRADAEASRIDALFSKAEEAPKVVPEPVLSRRERDREAQAARRKKHLSHLHDEPNVDELKRTVFVGNLPNNTTKRDLFKLFRDCGDIESTRIRSVMVQPTAKPDPNADDGEEPKGQWPGLKPKLKNKVGKGLLVLQGKISKDENASANGYVLFKQVSSVDMAVGKSGSLFNDHHIVVTKEDARSKAFSPINSVFIGNLAYNVSDEAVWQFFISNGCGAPDRVRIIRDRETNEGKGFGYVSFTTTIAMRKAIALANQGHLLQGRPVRISQVKKSNNPAIQAPTRREKRALQGDGNASTGMSQDQKRRKKEKIASRKEEFGGDGEAKPEWMGTTTNPRKKIPRDLRWLTQHPEDRKEMKRQRLKEAGRYARLENHKKNLAAAAK